MVHPLSRRLIDDTRPWIASRGAALEADRISLLKEVKNCITISFIESDQEMVAHRTKNDTDVFTTITTIKYSLRIQYRIESSSR